MPELSRFFGIIVRMFREPDEPHHDPHLQAVVPGSCRRVRTGSDRVHRRNSRRGSTGLSWRG